MNMEYLLFKLYVYTIFISYLHETLLHAPEFIILGSLEVLNYIFGFEIEDTLYNFNQTFWHLFLFLIFSKILFIQNDHGLLVNLHSSEVKLLYVLSRDY